jgi:nucleoside-diphosphate-sugar epimerase
MPTVLTAGKREVVLVTGYPAFSARHLVDHLLATEPDTEVAVVVRDKFLPDVRHHTARMPEEQRARLKVYEGDAAHMDLGLSRLELRELAATVDRIHHVAEVSYLGADRKSAEEVNLGGTREILEVASLCTKLSLLVHHSTALVSGDRRGTVLESELDQGQGFRNVVEETKARAEKLVRAAMPHLPIAVVRPSILVGSSADGSVDRMDGPYLMFLLILTSPKEVPLPLPGRGEVRIPLVPVDYVVRAALAIGRDGSAAGQTFHLVDPKPRIAREVFELVARAGGKRSPRGFLPANLTRALLHAPGLERLAKNPRTFIEQLATEVHYDARATEGRLGPLGIACPSFDSYVDRLVDVVRERVRERRETTRRDEDVDDPFA